MADVWKGTFSIPMNVCNVGLFIYYVATQKYFKLTKMQYCVLGHQVTTFVFNLQSLQHTAVLAFNKV